MQAFTCLLLASFALVASALPSGRIVGGTDAPEGKYPYQVSLQNNGRHFCGGSILNKRYILTAAHCIRGQSPNAITVLAGTNNVNGGGVTYKVEKLITHNGYNALNSINDIGLVRVNQDIHFTNKIQPIRIQTKNDVAAGDYVAVASGWGRLGASANIPTKLQHITINVIHQQKCKQTYWQVKDSHICTFTSVGKGMCNGDSGGPLVANGAQIGLVSFGRPCAVGYPDVFTRVSAFASWINENSRV